MNVRRFFANASIALGAVNILNFYSPRPIPTVGISAFIVGGLFIGLGLVLRSPPGSRINWSGLVGLFGQNRRSALGDSPVGRAAGGRTPNGMAADSSAAGRTPQDRLLAVRVLKLASEHGGRLTIAQTAIELSVPLDDAERALDECAAKGAASIDVSDKTGLASYRFPEYLPTDPS